MPISQAANTMQKKDFIQQAAIAFLPQLSWDIEQTMKYAERLWERLGESGYGSAHKHGPREIERAYDKLPTAMKAAFDLFWLAFDYKRGKDQAAASWLQLNPDKDQTQAIHAAAKQEAINRKNLPPEQVPIMAQGWLNKRRWLDTQASSTEIKQQEDNKRGQELHRINQDLAHAKRLAGQTGEQYWADEATRLTEKMKQLRDQQP